MPQCNTATLPALAHLEITGGVDRTVGVLVRVEIGLHRAPLFPVNTILRGFEVVVLRQAFALLPAPQSPRDEGEPADEDGASDAADDTPDDLLVGCRQVGARATSVGQRGLDCRGGEAGCAAEDAVGGDHRTVDATVGCPV